MADQTTTHDVLACVSLAVGVFGASLVPFLLLVDAEHLTPRWLRESTVLERAALTAANAVDRARLAAVKALLLLLRLSTTKGAVR
ncbi:hypothetical protein [Streptomyces silaceus]|uniref:hypothetical protein n=1 Tax=Streptomyces silaceus TaxID=545123 RepID=UPI0006EBB714|nr:hypothetical protein [Streptomyces silaceus]